MKIAEADAVKIIEKIETICCENNIFYEITHRVRPNNDKRQLDAIDVILSVKILQQ